MLNSTAHTDVLVPAPGRRPGPAPEVTGTEALLDVLVSEGVRHVFGNPGTTELPLLAGLEPAGIGFVLGLHEAVAVGMADGYARLTGRPAFVNLHSTAGLGNGLGVLTNSAAAGTPLVVTAGQQDYRHIAQEPLLSGRLAELAAPLVKWSHEARSRHELAVMGRRAFQLAAARPTGPVFLSLPVNFLDEAGPGAPARSTVLPAAGGEVTDLADLLLATPAGRLALVYGDEVTGSTAAEEGRRLAELLDAPVYGPSWPGSNPFPTDHPLWRGFLHAGPDGFATSLAGHDRVLVVGGRALTGYVYTPAPLLPARVELLQITADPAALGRQQALRLGVVGDVGTTLAALRAAIGTRRRPPGQPHPATAGPAPDPVAAAPSRLTHDAVARVVADTLPRDAYLVEEALSTRPALWRHLRLPTAGRYLAPANAGLGWAMPAACGAALAAGGAPVLCVVGDGAALYTPQSLWNAAHQHLPVTFLVVNNTRYQVLDTNWHRMRPDDPTPPPLPGLDLVSPAVRFSSLAHAMGIESHTVDTPTALHDVLTRAFEEPGPRLVEALLPDGS
ncbi:MULTISPECIES: thiamine pyrophosphate-binding protein [Kitasatospora]|uniref:Putative benzoylformate decarboxylase n=1 Tax=Kitasatospora setae (strain ATCC 33774 / DSM 43861 / JCM 3304 / KCC A-0304 / NBRC 14216 / KM-6054) TaxID=452652 RepID=E4NJY5_KITSK|nr:MULTISPECIES: thiamine pyrophosphate-binding protein [Kitasatospora]BAJ33283.1 putative benzoylformate decarboxylase [Kitasatospora setae KM-6054]